MLFLGRLQDVAGAGERSVEYRADVTELIDSFEADLSAALRSLKVRVAVNGAVSSRTSIISAPADRRQERNLVAIGQDSGTKHPVDRNPNLVGAQRLRQPGLERIDQRRHIGLVFDRPFVRPSCILQPAKEQHFERHASPR